MSDVSDKGERIFNSKPEADEMFSTIDDIMAYCTNTMNELKLKRLSNEDDGHYNSRSLNARLSISMSLLATLYNFTIRNMARELNNSGESSVIIESVNNYELKMVSHVHDCTLEFLNELLDNVGDKIERDKIERDKETDPCLS